jgi:hypothetical protein
MHTDAQIREGARALLESVSVPAVPLAAIQERILSRRRFVQGKPAYPWRRAIAVVLALIALPSIAFAVVSYEARSRAALQAHGGWAPPAPPAAFVSQLKSKTVTLYQARSAADFTLVVPSGLPAGTFLMRIETGPIGLYDGNAQEWRTEPGPIIFRYRRGEGRCFEISAQRYNERALPGRYIFEDRGPDARGNPVLVKHERFAWRNGDQMMDATADDAISKGEILAVVRSMDGTLLSLPWPSPHTGATFQILHP